MPSRYNVMTLPEDKNSICEAQTVTKSDSGLHDNPCLSYRRHSKDKPIASMEKLPQDTDSNATAHSRKDKDQKVKERGKKKTPWYNSLYPTYKSRSDDFKRLFKDVIPPDERLIVDYSCALQRDILVQGRLYASQNYLCFYANIFRWETMMTVRWREVTAITKEKTALVIPNAIQVLTENEKYFLTSFAARDKTYNMMLRIWQNELRDQALSSREIWQWVHASYGDELGLSSDEDEFTFITAAAADRPKSRAHDSATAAPNEASTGEPELDAPVAFETSSQVAGSIGMRPFSSGSRSRKTSDTDNSDIEKDATIKERLERSLGTQLSESIQPTDFSDTSESELGDIDMLAASCPCEHEGRLMANTELACSVDELFTMLFTGSQFIRDFHHSRKNIDVNFASWEADPLTKQKVRKFSLTVPLNQAVGPKTSQVSETQTLLDCSKTGEIYAIDSESSNAGIPYADSFYIKTHYCLLQCSRSPPRSSLTVYCQIKYRKSVWGLVKNFIEKNCWSGLEDNYLSLVKALGEECEKAQREAELTRRKLRYRHRGRPLKMNARQATQSYLTEKMRDGSSTPRKPLEVTSMSGKPSEFLGRVIFCALVSLLFINAVLFYKLWSFEDAYNKHETASFFSSEACLKRPDDWFELVRRKPVGNNIEIENWYQLIKSTTFLLHQAENTLNKMQTSLQSTLNEHIINILKNSLSTQRS